VKKVFLKINEENYHHISYGFFTRIGGFSKNNYSSLNCNLSSGDNPKIVKKNIQFAMDLLSLKNKKLKLPKQIHSNIIEEINNQNLNKEIKADGLITNNFSIALGILTADCTPIFIFDKSKSFICCLHVGWKGCLMNIVKNSMKLILKYNQNINDIVAIIGPCLAKENFEVSINFKNDFIKSDSNYDKFFTKKNSDKDLFDMRNLINFQFKILGITNIFNVNENTYLYNELFFSHRRATHEKLSGTGRMINIISFR
jgi:YfiH family protein